LTSLALAGRMSMLSLGMQDLAIPELPQFIDTSLRVHRLAAGPQ
jgi:hypothetical protein